MAHQLYENIVLSNRINDILKTKIDLNNYMTIDNTLAENPGMKKKVITRTSTGNVEELGVGEGNTTSLEVQKNEVEYEVKTYQGMFKFQDEEEMTDAMAVDTGLKHSADNMVNKFTEMAIAELDRATLTVEATAWNFNAVVDGIAKMNLEDEAGLFLLTRKYISSSFHKIFIIGFS